MKRTITTPNRPPLSEAQLAANRANAQHSTGPRSAEGKARAAANALKHGLRAHNLYLLRNESPDELEALRQSLTAEFRPHTPSQHLLLQQLIAFQIRYLRAQRYYNHLLFDKVDEMRPQVEQTYLPPHNQDVANALAYESLANNGRALQLLTRDLDRLPTRILRLIGELKSFPPPEEWDEENEIDTANDTNEPISSPDLRPADEEKAPEPEPVLACSRPRCIEIEFPCQHCRPMGEVPRVNDWPDWPPDCVETHEDPDVSLFNYHMQNPDIANFVNPYATMTDEEIWEPEPILPGITYPESARFERILDFYDKKPEIPIEEAATDAEKPDNVSNE
jgi:hypothetical protein